MGSSPGRAATAWIRAIGSPQPCSAAGRTGLSLGWGTQGGFMALNPPHVQSQRHLMLASPSRPSWPVSLSRLPTLVATSCAAPVHSGVVGWGLSTRPDGSVPCLVDLQRVETSAESYLNCKTDKESLPWCTQRTCQPPAQRWSFPQGHGGSHQPCRRVGGSHGAGPPVSPRPGCQPTCGQAKRMRWLAASSQAGRGLLEDRASGGGRQVPHTHGDPSFLQGSTGKRC